jgi:tetratricopeptide (TPR) repeat protein
MIRARAVRIAAWVVAGVFYGSGLGTARAQDIDTLFLQFKESQSAGNYQGAEQIAWQMLRISPTAGWQAASWNCLGRAVRAQGRPAEAEQHYRRGLAIPLAADNVNVGWIPNNLALALLDQKRYAEAEPLLAQALNFFERLKGPQSSEVATVSQALGTLEHDRERYAESEAYHRRALAIREGLYGTDHEDVSYSLEKLGDVYRHLKRLPESETHLKRALAMQEKVLGRDHIEVSMTLHNLGALYRDKGEYKAAEAADRRALAIKERLNGPRAKALLEILTNLAIDLEKQQKTADAATVRARIAEIGAQRSAPGRKRIQITAESANVMDGAQVLTAVRKGQEFDVTQTNGDWYAIEVSIAGVNRAGWVLNRDVTEVTPNQPAPPVLEPTSLVWQQFAPPGGRFTISFPGPPKSVKQTVNGIDSPSYVYETSKATYFVSYFDLPADRTLSFDAAIGAYTTARQGAVQSLKNLDIDLYPGREAIVKLPNGNLSRLRLLAAGRRWYQVIAEGPPASINGDVVNNFIVSFKLAN